MYGEIRNMKLVLRQSGTLSHIFIFTKGNNFCDFQHASLDNKAFPKGDLLLKERICSKEQILSALKGKNLLLGANSFL